MSSKRTAKYMVWARRLVQTACLLLFGYWFWRAGIPDPKMPEVAARVPFFDLDPLILFSTWLAGRALPFAAGLALLTVVVTLVFGRVFCGWICPLGAIHHFVAWLRRFVRDTRPARDNWVPWQRAKYYLLVTLIVLALFGVQWVGIFDPISLLYRATATALYPGTQYLVEEGANAVYQADPGVGPFHLKALTEPIYQYLRGHLFNWNRQAFEGGSLILFLFVGIVLLNLYRARFWCRYVCPLGALLGLISQRQPFRLIKKPTCTACGLCATRCPAAANPDKPGDWRATECYGCWNCAAACNRDGVTFGFRTPLRAPSNARMDLSKRALLEAGAASMGTLVLFRLSPVTQERKTAPQFTPSLIRPPGARSEREFLSRCVKCGVCMKVCPTNGLQPTLFQAGLEGIWTPVLTPLTGYCAYDCVACGHVCPTGAIAPLTMDEKKATRIGLAAFDLNRCLPYAYGRECMVCEEHCPTPKKAIYFQPQEVRLRNGTTVILKQPRVDADRCIGCGICENVCVFKDLPAVRVTSANETRHSNNRPILTGSPLQENVEPTPAIPEAPSNADTKDSYGSGN